MWTLLLALGMVILAMRQLNQPETAQRLGQLFGAKDLESAGNEGEVVPLDSISDSELTPSTKPLLGTENPPAETSLIDEEPTENEEPTKNTDAFAQIRDNTYFRPAESEAWFGLFESLQSTRANELSEASLGELTYAQLLKQPDHYRGKVVTVRGTVRREELQQAPDNGLNIETYHRLWIEPVGGGHWPIVVYCLEVPEQFPRGDGLSAPVSVTGYFFKNWSYPWSDGLGIAPVVLSRDVKWNKPVTSFNQNPTTERSWFQGIAIACAFAALVVYVSLRNTRRPPRTLESSREVKLPDSGTPVESVREQLAKLAETEAQP